MSKRAEEAVQLFEQGFNCAQAIVTTYGPAFGLDRKNASKVACGFGGGMRMAGVCGAVTGAFMVIGLKHGNTRPEDKDTKQKTYEIVQDFTKRFRARNNFILCKDLLGCDISTPDGLRIATEKGLFKSVCPKLVRCATEILEQMLFE